LDSQNQPSPKALPCLIGLSQARNVTLAIGLNLGDDLAEFLIAHLVEYNG
jgi:hypothetical protein